ncbi:MAG: anhydro-N-acetylmuramic acid kinase [Pseudomonadota bacterium]|nr:anhydro-N-acetylmuramic acid kinase [Pseudomonadota bacterium]
MTKNLFIGQMSGTSLDGIDTVLVDFSTPTPTLQKAINTPIPAEIYQSLLTLRQPEQGSIHQLAELDHEMGHLFADSVKQLLSASEYSAEDITAIGCHGQTIRHQPNAKIPYTLQIGDPNIIAAKTGITTIADFRRKDLALGGQGAPIVPGYHELIWRNGVHDRMIVNIGGIANLTWLPKDLTQPLLAFDTGPGNTLMNAWVQQHRSTAYDENGAWAASGSCIPALLNVLLEDTYFTTSHPKSTGTDYFNLTWLQPKLQPHYAPEDVQATLLELTAEAIVRSITTVTQATCEIILCGGGANNQTLFKRIQQLSKSNTVTSSDQYQISVDWLEAIAFAWLAKRTLEALPGNIPSATGASTHAILGGIYQA